MQNNTQNNTISAVQTVKNAFPFSVDKYPLTGPDNMPAGYYGLFRSDTESVVGGQSVAKGYTPHQTEDVVALVNAASKVFENPRIDCTFNKGHIVNVIPSNDHRRAIYGTNDNIFPRLIITAGYDKKAFKATLGIYRDACSNLQMLSSVENTTVSIRHSSGLADKIDSLVKTFETLASSWDGMVDRMKAMEETKIYLPDFLNQVYPMDANTGARTRASMLKGTEAIFYRLQDERLKTQRPTLARGDYTVSAYEAYNAVQGYVEHDAQKRRVNTPLMNAIRAANAPAVKKAEVLAMELAGVDG